MSGLSGCITSISKEFNEISGDNTVEGMKMANYNYTRVKQAELEKKENEKAKKSENTFDKNTLLSDIQHDVDEARER